MGIILSHAADIHLGSLKGLRGVPFEAKLQRHKNVLKFIFETARSQHVDYAILAGDIFDTTDAHPKIRDLLLKALLHYHDVQTIIINGNHDEIETGYTTLHPLILLQQKGKLEHVEIAECSPRVVEKPDIWFVMVPYTGDSSSAYKKRVKRLLQMIPINDRRPIVVVGHEMVVNSGDDSGWVADSGIEVPNLRRVTYWAFGDIHKCQQLSGLPNAWYPGSPAQHRFSELPNKGLLIVNTDAPTKPRRVLNKHPGVKSLISVDTDDEKELESLPHDAWVSLKTSKIGGIQKVGANVVKSTPVQRGDDTEVISLRKKSRDPLEGLQQFLISRVGLDVKESKDAERIARRL
jgi:DNA repair exonuclease SbcCD nuclease subunit